MATGTRRVREKQTLRQHVVDVLGTEVGPLQWHGVAPTDCIHGCAGGRYGCSEQCNFTCHEEGDDD